MKMDSLSREKRPRGQNRGTAVDEKTDSSAPLKRAPYFLIKSIEKAFRLLEILCLEGEIGVSELGKRVNLKKANVHRLLATLSHLGYAEKDPATAKYRPTFKTFELGSALINRIGVQTIAHPYLEQLGKQFGETNNLGVLSQGEVVYIDKVESSESLRMDLKVGIRLPAYCTALGKVLIAHLPPAELEEYLRRQKLFLHTPRTVISPEKLRKNLKKVREQGYALDEQEYAEGICCIAAPVRDYRGKVVAAISVAGPSIRVNGGKLAQLQEPLIEVAGKISKKLGYAVRE